MLRSGIWILILGSVFLPVVALGQTPPVESVEDVTQVGAGQAAEPVVPSGQTAAAAASAPACKLWACGVSRERREKALKLYNDGNKLFDELHYADAVQLYEEALAAWEHPRIHYNLMLALMELERPIAAYESGLAALGYDGAALKEQQRHEARRHVQNLRGQLAEVTVETAVDGMSVAMDGEQLLTKPGRVTRLVEPGEHSIVARKAEHLNNQGVVELWPRERKTVTLDMLRKDEEYLVTRRWERWMPYAVLAGAAGVGLAGGLLQWRSSVNNRAFGALFADECEPPLGCKRADYTADMVARETRYTWYRRTGLGTLALGGAAAAAGLVLWYLNRPTVRANPRRDTLFRVSVTSQGAGALLSYGF